MRRAPTYYLTLAIVSTLIALAIVFLFNRIQLQYDVTANARHTLTTQTQSTLKAFSGPIKVQAVLGPDQNTREAVTELISRYQSVKPDLELTFINPETNPERARELKANPNGELIISGNDREQRLQQLSERVFTGALRQLSREGERNIAFIVGHEERSINSDAPSAWSTALSRLATSGYHARELNLVTESIVDPSTDLVVIADPRRAYFPGEIAALLEYLNRGGNLLWLTDTDINNPAGAGISAIALEFGIDTLEGVVIDADSQAAGLESPTMVVLNKLPRHPLTNQLNASVVLPQAKALAITPLAGQTTLPLLQTGESSWTELGILEGAVRFDEHSKETPGPLTLAVSIERQLPNGIQRVAILGDADFGSNQFVGTGGNQALTESLIVWLSGDADQLEFVTQPAPDSSLQLDPGNIITLSVVWLAAIPILFFSSAVIVAYRRRR